MEHIHPAIDCFRRRRVNDEMKLPNDCVVHNVIFEHPFQSVSTTLSVFVVVDGILAGGPGLTRSKYTAHPNIRFTQRLCTRLLRPMFDAWQPFLASFKLAAAHEQFPSIQFLFSIFLTLIWNYALLAWYLSHQRAHNDQWAHLIFSVHASQWWWWLWNLR